MLNGMRRGALSILATGALLAVPTVALGAGVDPATYDAALDPGQTVHVTKTVTTPVIPPKPDIVLVVDETSSMASAIGSVKADLGSIITTVKGAQPDAQFAVVSYKDFGDPDPFEVNTDLTPDQPTAQAAVDGLTAAGGGDFPEAQLNALWQVGTGGHAISFRPGSSRIVVWFGDAPGHDPSNGHTLGDAISSLQGAGAQVVAISVGINRLDDGGQATAITTATSGTFLSGVPAAQVSDAILAGLSNLPAEVSTTTTCDPGLGVAFSPSLPQTVPSGTDLVLDEAITVAPDAPQGSTLSCSTAFLVNGADAGPGFVQTVRIKVDDVTAPTAACGPGVNPAGKTPPGYASAGFYRLLATDNLPGVSVTVSDTASSASFGPYAPGTTIKLTQAPGATPAAVPGAGAVDWNITVKGDLLVTATDAAGNTATATCAVPPKQK